MVDWSLPEPRGIKEADAAHRLTSAQDHLPGGRDFRLAGLVLIFTVALTR